MKDFSGINSPFKDAIMPVPGMSGDNVAQSNGLSIRDGEAGTGRIAPEVTTVSVKDDSAPTRPYDGKQAGIRGS